MLVPYTSANEVNFDSAEERDAYINRILSDTKALSSNVVTSQLPSTQVTYSAYNDGRPVTDKNTSTSSSNYTLTKAVTDNTPCLNQPPSFISLRLTEQAEALIQQQSRVEDLQSASTQLDRSMHRNLLSECTNERTKIASQPPSESEPIAILTTSTDYRELTHSSIIHPYLDALLKSLMQTSVREIRRELTIQSL